MGSLLQVEQPVTQTELHKCVFSAASGTASQTNGVTQMVVSLLQVEQPARKLRDTNGVFSAASGTASFTNRVTQMVFSLLLVEQPVTQTESHKWCFLCSQRNSQSDKRSHTNGGFSAASGTVSHTNGVTQMVF